jgi:hypothetical protein
VAKHNPTKWAVATIALALDIVAANLPPHHVVATIINRELFTASNRSKRPKVHQRQREPASTTRHIDVFGGRHAVRATNSGLGTPLSTAGNYIKQYHKAVLQS